MKVELLGVPVFGLNLKSNVGYCSMVPVLMYPECEDLYIVRVEGTEVPCFESDFRIIGEDDNEDEAKRNFEEQVNAANIRLMLAKDAKESGLVVVNMEEGKYKSFDIFTTNCLKHHYELTKVNWIRFILDICDEEKIPLIICDKKRASNFLENSDDFFIVELKHCVEDGVVNIEVDAMDDLIASIIAMQSIKKGMELQKRMKERSSI